MHKLHLPRFYVYGNVFDFRRGNPTAARSGPANKFARKLTLFPGAEKGSIDIEACLLPRRLQAKGNDAKLMGILTTKLILVRKQDIGMDACLATN